MTNGLSSACFISMFVEVLLFSVVSVHGLRLTGASIASDVFGSSYAALLVVGFGSLNMVCNGLNSCWKRRKKKNEFTSDILHFKYTSSLLCLYMVVLLALVHWPPLRWHSIVVHIYLQSHQCHRYRNFHPYNICNAFLHHLPLLPKIG